MSSTQHPHSSHPVGTQVSPEDPTTGPAPHTAGPHKSDIVNKLDPRVDSDLSKQKSSDAGVSHAAGGAGTTSTTHTGSTQKTAGPHSSNVANKADPRIDSDRDNRARHQPGTVASDVRTGPASRTAGPHGSDLANKADPRIDSDVDNRGQHASGALSNNAHTGSAQKTAGPHSSNVANKVDPRVDSDLDNRARHQPGTLASDTHTGPGSRTAGPHSSDLANKGDPRIDSDLDNRGKHATGTTHSHNTSHLGGGVAGTGAATSTTAGPHSSGMANKVDPRVDSDLDNRAQYAPGTTKAGNEHPYSTTRDTSLNSSSAGPHQSKMMNKLDPRVDAQTGDVSTKTTNQHHGPGFSGDTRGQYETGATGASTGAGYTSSGVGYNPAQPSSSALGSKSAQTGANVGSGVKGAFAGAHGVGESLRGGLNAAVDKTFGHEEGVAKNDAIASQGEREMRTGNFGRGNAY